MAMTPHPYLTANVHIHSDLTLEKVANVLSRVLFAGAPFGGKNDYIYDEVPAVYIAKNHSPLGLYITLQGYGGKTGYLLEMISDTNLSPHSTGDNYTPVDLSPYLALLLRDIEGIAIQ